MFYDGTNHTINYVDENSAFVRVIVIGVQHTDGPLLVDQWVKYWGPDPCDPTALTPIGLNDCIQYSLFCIFVFSIIVILFVYLYLFADFCMYYTGDDEATNIGLF